MRNVQALKWRRAGGWIGGLSLVLLSLYLRCFVFLKISPGALLVYLAFVAGVLWIADARKASRTLKSVEISN
jgi:hypothetical protein